MSQWCPTLFYMQAMREGLPGCCPPHKRSGASVKATLGPRARLQGESIEKNAVHIPCTAAAQAVWVLMRQSHLRSPQGQGWKSLPDNGWWNSSARSSHRASKMCS